jgi:hypothetical protein
VAAALLRKVYPKPRKLKKDDASVAPDPDEGDAYRVNQDSLVWEAADNGRDVIANGQYGFEMAADDVNAGVVDGENPVLSYHPVFHFGPTPYVMSIGHMADIHLVSRQQILAKSKAKVIEHEDFPATIGSMVNVCSKNIVSLFSEFRDDDEINAIVIGGDVVDFNPGAVLGDPDRTPKISDVWADVSVKKGWKDRYHDNVDLLSTYSVIVHNYRQGDAKPVYLVSGNHDCYYSPFGISPRAMGERTNEGIPADHNLTFYEAILCFGPSATTMTKATASKIGDPFDKKYFAWFYQVFTPFRDFSIKLPKQVLIGLRWGDEESLLAEGGSADQASVRKFGLPYKWGFLPRSDHAISKRQLGLIESSLDKDRKVILATHFTFVSYQEKLSEAMAQDIEWGDRSKQGDIYFGTYSFADMGTFESNREKVFKNILEKDRSIHCILTGHSHRRGLYTIRKGISKTWVGHNSVKTDFHVFPTTERTGGSYDWGDPRNADGAVPPPRRNLNNPDGTTEDARAEAKPPWIIVSDSGGSIPRRNINGEFNGRGSDRPSGTKVVFDLNGEVERVQAVPVDVCGTDKPRLVVALDYYDIQEGKKIIESIVSEEFPVRDELIGPAHVDFAVELRPELDSHPYSIELSEMALYRHATYHWEKFPFTKTGVCWRLTAAMRFDVLYLFKCGKKSSGEIFLSMKFKAKQGSPLAPYYDFDSPWTFEVELKREEFKTDKKSKDKFVRYKIERCGKRAEIPNHDARKKKYPGIYS